MIPHQVPSLANQRVTVRLQRVTRPPCITYPTNHDLPLVWVLAMGAPAPQQDELFKHYQQQAEARGYGIGFIDAGNDPAAAVKAMQASFGNDQVLLLNTDAPQEMVDAVRGELQRRASSLRQIGSANGAPLRTGDLMTWQALGCLHDHVTGSAGDTLWTVAQLETALRSLALSVPGGASPPHLYLQQDLQRHREVAQAITGMQGAGRLNAITQQLATKLAIFWNNLGYKEAAAGKRADDAGGFSG